jgi:hypothetical protein
LRCTHSRHPFLCRRVACGGGGADIIRSSAEEGTIQGVDASLETGLLQNAYLDICPLDFRARLGCKHDAHDTERERVQKFEDRKRLHDETTMETIFNSHLLRYLQAP